MYKLIFRCLVLVWILSINYLLVVGGQFNGLVIIKSKNSDVFFLMQQVTQIFGLLFLVINGGIIGFSIKKWLDRRRAEKSQPKEAG